MEPLPHDPDPLDNGVTIQVNKEEELNLNFSTFLAVYFAGVHSPAAEEAATGSDNRSAKFALDL